MLRHTSISLHFHKLTSSDHKEEKSMFLGLEWYWWLVILTVLIISLPLKVKFMKWWGNRNAEQKRNRRGKWGEDE